MDVAVIAAATSVVVSGVMNIAGWFANHYLTVRRENQRDQRAKEQAVAAEKKAEEAALSAARWRRDEESSQWKLEFREIAVNVKIEMVRARLPGEWYPAFQTSIQSLNRVVMKMPESIDPDKRRMILEIVHELTILPENEVIRDENNIFKMLSDLEELTN